MATYKTGWSRTNLGNGRNRPGYKVRPIQVGGNNAATGIISAAYSPSRHSGLWKVEKEVDHQEILFNHIGFKWVKAF